MTAGGRLPTGLIVQPGQARHDTGGHPENPTRIEAVIAGLEAAGELDGRPVEEAAAAGVEAPAATAAGPAAGRRATPA